MDAFEFDDKVLNSNSKPRSIHCLPKIKNLFRIIEISLILVFLTSASTRLPFAAKITGEYFRRFISVAVTPLFIFLLTNAIALSLFLNSRHHFPLYEYSQISMEPDLEFFQEFIRNGDNRRETSFKPEEVVFEDKEAVVEVREVTEDDDRKSESSSEKQLDGLEAEKGRRSVADGGEVEELSNEEFQRAIEAFIAKQIKFHQEEKVAIVLHGRA